MKFKNTVKAYVPVGSRESVPPFGVTRDFTAEEIEKSPEIRHARERGYLVEYDGKSPAPVSTAPKKVLYQSAADSVAGEAVRKTTTTGKVVEYISATEVGADDVQTADQGDGVIAAVEGKQPLETIEKGVDAGKPKWQSASDAFEAELKEETTGEMEFDDEDTLAEQEDDRTDALDADHAIDEDNSQFVRAQGNMGAEVTTVREVVQTETAKATAAVAQAVAGSFDDAEKADGAGKEAAELLAQPFAAKKWIISKTSDGALLKDIAEHTKSENVKTLAQQRLSELEKAA